MPKESASSTKKTKKSTDASVDTVPSLVTKRKDNPKVAKQKSKQAKASAVAALGSAMSATSSDSVSMKAKVEGDLIPSEVTAKKTGKNTKSASSKDAKTTSKRVKKEVGNDAKESNGKSQDSPSKASSHSESKSSLRGNAEVSVRFSSAPAPTPSREIKATVETGNSDKSSAKSSGVVRISTPPRLHPPQKPQGTNQGASQSAAQGSSQHSGQSADQSKREASTSQPVTIPMHRESAFGRDQHRDSRDSRDSRDRDHRDRGEREGRDSRDNRDRDRDRGDRDGRDRRNGNGQDYGGFSSPETVGGPQDPYGKKNNRRRNRNKNKGRNDQPQDYQAQASHPYGTPQPAPQQHIDQDEWAQKAWKIFLGEVTEDGLALIDDPAAKELANRAFRVAELFLLEKSRRLSRPVARPAGSPVSPGSSAYAPDRTISESAFSETSSSLLIDDEDDEDDEPVESLDAVEPSMDSMGESIGEEVEELVYDIDRDPDAFSANATEVERIFGDHDSDVYDDDDDSELDV